MAAVLDAEAEHDKIVERIEFYAPVVGLVYHNYRTELVEWLARLLNEGDSCRDDAMNRLVDLAKGAQA